LANTVKILNTLLIIRPQEGQLAPMIVIEQAAACVINICFIIEKSRSDGADVAGTAK